MWRTQRAIENFNSSQPPWILTDFFFFCNILNLYSTVQRLIHCPCGLMQLMSAEQRGAADPTVKQEAWVLPGSNPRLIPTQFGACSREGLPTLAEKIPTDFSSTPESSSAWKRVGVRLRRMKDATENPRLYCWSEREWWSMSKNHRLLVVISFFPLLEYKTEAIVFWLQSWKLNKNRSYFASPGLLTINYIANSVNSNIIYSI